MIIIKRLYIGDKFQIQCYKHDGKIHRSWDEAVLLDIKKNYLVFGNNKTLVRESEGITWRTKEPAIMYFFKDKWYNVIAQMKSDGIYYYCNIATPFIIEDGTIKYIDYDLDLRVFPQGEYKILDKGEYECHRKAMNYSDDLDKVINNGMDELIQEYTNMGIMFNSVANYDYLREYLDLKSQSINER